MSKIKDFLKSPLGTALCAAAACLLAVVLVWLAAVRPNNDKSLSERISDDYSQYSAELDEANGAAQTFDTDNDLLAMAFVFGTSNGQPTGELHLELADADTGEDKMLKGARREHKTVMGSTLAWGWIPP